MAVRRCRRAGLLLPLLVAAGCATRADLLRVERDQREVRALLADQQVTVDKLRRQVEMMRGQLGNTIGRGKGMSSAEAAQWLNDLEARIAAIERATGMSAELPVDGSGLVTETLPGGGAFPPAAAGTGMAVPPAVAGSDLEAALAREEEALRGGRLNEEFRQALQLIREGQCGQAISELRKFIRSNPKAVTADNAQYWIGHCYYTQRDYNRAIIELNEVLLKYPKGDRVPASLLMLADAFADSGDKIDARLILQKLISDHPMSEEAALGQQRLQALGE
jgi:tol-pal system protein YbgF